MEDSAADRVDLERGAGERKPVTRLGGQPARPYRAPRLVSYGKLSEVTRFGGSAVLDSGATLGPQP